MIILYRCEGKAIVSTLSRISQALITVFSLPLSIQASPPAIQVSGEPWTGRGERCCRCCGSGVAQDECPAGKTGRVMRKGDRRKTCSL